ncbi:hypothetical protein [Candidatus Methylacidithermus pantelleriae]|nr:hypothetical protein [Candidatus Methylacidithermus pantelleriae]
MTMWLQPRHNWKKGQADLKAVKYVENLMRGQGILNYSREPGEKPKISWAGRLGRPLQFAGKWNQIAVGDRFDESIRNSMIKPVTGKITYDKDEGPAPNTICPEPEHIRPEFKVRVRANIP